MLSCCVDHVCTKLIPIKKKHCRIEILVGNFVLLLWFVLLYSAITRKIYEKSTACSKNSLFV